MADKDLIKDILNTSDEIGFVTICDMDGKNFEAGHFDPTKNLLSFSENITFLKTAAKSWKSRNMFSSKIGQAKFTVSVHEKHKRITIGFGDEHLIFMTVNVNADHKKIINGVIKLEKKYLKI